MSGTITRIFGDSIINAKTSKEDFDIIKHSGKEVRYKAEGKHIFEEWGGDYDVSDEDFVPFIQLNGDDSTFTISSQNEYKELSKRIDEKDYIKISNTKLSFTKEALNQKEITLKFSVKKGNKKANDTDGEIFVKYTTIKGQQFVSNKKNTLEQSLGIKIYDDPIPIKIKNTPEFFKTIQYIDFILKMMLILWLINKALFLAKKIVGG